MSKMAVMFYNDMIGQICSEMSLALGKTSLNTRSARTLLFMIAAHESHLVNRKQIGGPALSLFQIEPDTLDDLYTNWLAHRSAWQTVLDSYRMVGTTMLPRLEALESVDAYGVCAARMQLWRAVEKIPGADDYLALADYAKRHWNTEAGKASPEKYLTDFNRLGGPDICKA